MNKLSRQENFQLWRFLHHCYELPYSKFSLTFVLLCSWFSFTFFFLSLLPTIPIEKFYRKSKTIDKLNNCLVNIRFSIYSFTLKKVVNLKIFQFPLPLPYSCQLSTLFRCLCFPFPASKINIFYKKNFLILALKLII